MRSYSLKNPTVCQAFRDAESYDELLAAIARWWSSFEEDSKCLEAIVFHIDDDDSFNAEVYWAYLTPELKVALEELAASSRRFPEIKPGNIPHN